MKFGAMGREFGVEREGRVMTPNSLISNRKLRLKRVDKMGWLSYIGREVLWKRTENNPRKLTKRKKRSGRSTSMSFFLERAMI